MKKYLLLISLFTATFAMGALLYKEAHKNTSVASISDVDSISNSVFSEKAEIKETVLEETENTSDGLIKMGKDFFMEASESAARFIFSLIYK